MFNIITHSVHFSSVQSLSHVWFFVIPWTAALQASLSITNSQSLLKLMSIELVMASNCLILCHPLCLPSIFLTSSESFSNESVLCIRWPKDWSFSFSISSSKECSGLVSFRTDWFDYIDCICVCVCVCVSCIYTKYLTGDSPSHTAIHIQE